MIRSCLILASTAALASATPAMDRPSYRLSQTVPLGVPDRWDYVVADAATARVYFAHGDRVTVLDARTGVVVGAVSGMPGGTHGTAISTATGQGFTDDGEKGEVVAFDLKSLEVLHRIPAASDADGMAIDPGTARLFVVDGDPGMVTVIDSKSDRPVATIAVGEKLESVAVDGSGRVFVAGEAKSDLVAIDAASAKVVARWPTPDCKSPHGLAVDARSQRAFLGCANSRMMVVDTRTGRVVANLTIGLGNDSVAFDPVRRRLFSSNGRDGTVSVFQQETPDTYRALATIPTTAGARTMSVDPASGRLFVAGADTDPSTTPGGRPRVRPGTLHVMIFDPVG